MYKYSIKLFNTKTYLILTVLFIGIIFPQCESSNQENKVNAPIEVTENDRLKMLPFDEYQGASEPFKEEK